MKAVNLLPPDLRGAASKHAPAAVASADEPGITGALAVIGALAFCVVALAAYVLATNTIKDRRAELDHLTTESAAVTQRAAALKPYVDFASMAAGRVQTVKDLTDSRFDWEQALRDISRAIPGDVTLASLTGTVSASSGGGSPLRAAIGKPAIELEGCTPTQRDVAVLMSRLRNVDGVTRVTLASSEKPERTAGPAVLGTAEAGDCGKGRHPAFDVIIFFEGSSTPATVQDVVVAPAVSDQAGGPAPSSSPTSTSSTSTSAGGSQPAGSDTGTESTPASTTPGAG